MAQVAAAPGPDLAAVRKGCLAPELRFENAAGAQDRPQSVFVTGATGFVGAFLLRELLEAQVAAYCLVRADDAVQGMQRLVSVLDGYGLWKPEYAPLVNPVVGDLTQRLFGLDEKPSTSSPTRSTRSATRRSSTGCGRWRSTSAPTWSAHTRHCGSPRAAGARPCT